ncbi:hypothetical protein M2189_005458 [Bradyrhizobium japonicum]|uniref:hypothetical protein n=1 Tax=Bradyrhizobium japonicum TaxID=375 RepID=UPI0021687430|nr:hypothetical protein [Bradyrhizobium japonicum]MCS3495583.1 hypothetical protein [Bradyrhizobium japonicum]MCS3962255.1 hypothetical protein [Bradyrhizobium japonicum]MCS3994572.1 hypothetical protein [Bradyrhizobium japonicum]
MSPLGRSEKLQTSIDFSAAFNERRDAIENALGIRIALIKATDRRRHETELLPAKELAARAAATQKVGAAGK